MLTNKTMLIVLTTLMLASCVRQNTDNLNIGKIQAYVPVYLSQSLAADIKIDSPKNTVEAGKIYVYGRYLFQNDINSGIHITDIVDRTNPKKIAFINVPLSTEIAVKGNYLYTNNLADLLTFDISNPASPVLKNRIKNVFPLANQTYPPFTNTYFECADASKGIVINWKLSEIQDPKCRR